MRRRTSVPPASADIWLTLLARGVRPDIASRTISVSDVDVLRVFTVINLSS